MFRFKITLLALVVTCTQWLAFSADADAGILRDWLNRRRARWCQQQAPAIPVNTVGYNGLQPGQCATTCQKTCSRVVVNYVPCTSYRTSYERVPVTQYRPQTSTDPCTGCSVTCMRPCTSYTYRMRRVPYTTYRPVYRTETYRVPVTTITNDCNTCGANPTCSTCATGQSIPGGTLTTDGSYQLQPGTTLPSGSTVTPLPTPADTTPSINPQDSNRSVIDSSTSGSSTRLPFKNQTDNWSLTSTEPVKIESVATASTINSPVTRDWTYSPIKQASYVSVEKPKLNTIRGQFKSESKTTLSRSDQNEGVNSAWQTVEW